MLEYSLLENKKKLKKLREKYFFLTLAHCFVVTEQDASSAKYPVSDEVEYVAGISVFGS